MQFLSKSLKQKVATITHFYSMLGLVAGKSCNLWVSCNFRVLQLVVYRLYMNTVGISSIVVSIMINGLHCQCCYNANQLPWIALFWSFFSLLYPGHKIGFALVFMANRICHKCIYYFYDSERPILFYPSIEMEMRIFFFCSVKRIQINKIP